MNLAVPAGQPSIYLSRNTALQWRRASQPSLACATKRHHVLIETQIPSNGRRSKLQSDARDAPEPKTHVQRAWRRQRGRQPRFQLRSSDAHDDSSDTGAATLSSSMRPTFSTMASLSDDHAECQAARKIVSRASRTVFCRAETSTQDKWPRGEPRWDRRGRPTRECNSCEVAMRRALPPLRRKRAS